MSNVTENKFRKVLGVTSFTSCFFFRRILDFFVIWSITMPDKILKGQFHSDFHRKFFRSVTLIHSFISNLSDDKSTASSKTIPPLNAI
jgi:hypothetical protein